MTRRVTHRRSRIFVAGRPLGATARLTALLGITITILVMGESANAQPRPNPRDNGLRGCPHSSAYVNFPYYWAGPSFEGKSVVARIRRCDRPYPGEGGRANFFSYIYGCEIELPGADCNPVEVQTWPGCERTLSNDGYGDRSSYDRIQVRGVPAAIDKFGFGELELYTGEVTVVIFANRRGQALRFARTLRSAPRSHQQTGDDENLPSPLPGHMAGRLLCGPSLRITRPSQALKSSGAAISPRVGLRLLAHVRRSVRLRVHLLRRNRGCQPQGGGSCRFRHYGYFRTQAQAGTNLVDITETDGARSITAGQYKLQVVAMDRQRDLSPRRHLILDAA